MARKTPTEIAEISRDELPESFTPSMPQSNPAFMVGSSPRIHPQPLEYSTFLLTFMSPNAGRNRGTIWYFHRDNPEAHKQAFRGGRSCYNIRLMTRRLVQRPT